MSTQQQETIELQLPTDVMAALLNVGITKQKFLSNMRKTIAIDLYRKRLFSFGKACEFTGVSKWEFISCLAENDVPVIDYTEEELLKEFKNVDKLEKELEKR